MATLSNNAWEVFANLLVDQAAWVYRRVESIEHFDRYNVRRKVSIDLEIPTIDPAAASEIRTFPVPLATLEKRPLNNLDVKVGDVSVSVLTTEENSELIASFLFAQAHLILGHQPDPHLQSLFTEVALFQPTSTTHADRMAEALREFTDRLDDRDADHRSLRGNLDFVNLVQTYGSSFELVALVPAHEGQRTIVKYSYDDIVRLDREALTTWKRILAEDQRPAGRIRAWTRKSRFVRGISVVLQRVGWASTPLHYPLPGVGAARSYHLEVAAPQGLEIHDGLAMAWRSVGATRDLQAQSRCGPSRRAHLHIRSATQGALGRVRVRMRPASAGWMRAAALSSMAIAAVLLAGWWAGHVETLYSDPQTPSRPAIAGLLIALPGVLAAFLVRAGEHALTSRLLLGVRLLLVASAALAYSAAGLLLLSSESPEDVWSVLALLALGVGVVITVAAFWPPAHTAWHSRKANATTLGAELQDLRTNAE